MLVFLLVCLPTTVYCMLSCRESCEACVAPSADNPPEVRKVYCSMCLECRGPRSKFEANMMMQETQFEAPAAEADEELDQPPGPAEEQPDDPDCPEGRCMQHSKEGEQDKTTQCPTQNCNQIPTICITIPPWACPTTTTPSTTTRCETTCKMFTECGGCGRRQFENFRRYDEPPEVYVAFPKGMNTNGNFVYKKVKKNKRLR